MVGRRIDHLFPERTTRPDPTRAALSVRGVSQPGVVKDITFDLHPGEALSISGLMGSGRSELARIVFGLDAHAAGEIKVYGETLPARSPHRAMELGLAFVTEDRRGEGLMMDAPVRDNIVLPSLPEHASPFLRFIRPTELGTLAGEMAEKVHLTARSPERTVARTLSGGNQQKVVIGKWLIRQPSIYILDEPTRGIVVGAKYEGYKIINQLVAAGASVLFISSEIEELIGMTDRILVMAGGELRGFHDRSQYQRETLLRALWD